MGMTRLRRFVGADSHDPAFPSKWPVALATNNRGILGANNQGTAEDARQTGLGGDLLSDAMDRIHADVGRVEEEDTFVGA
jgi:hypothetical protein